MNIIEILKLKIDIMEYMIVMSKKMILIIFIIK